MCSPQSGTVVSLRDGIMPEVYAITAEHQRRLGDPHEWTLDDNQVPTVECIVSLQEDLATLAGALTQDMFKPDTLHAIAIRLATDATEVARRVRPK